MESEVAQCTDSVSGWCHTAEHPPEKVRKLSTASVVAISDASSSSGVTSASNSSSSQASSSASGSDVSASSSTSSQASASSSTDTDSAGPPYASTPSTSATTSRQMPPPICMAPRRSALSLTAGTGAIAVASTTSDGLIQFSEARDPVMPQTAMVERQHRVGGGAARMHPYTRHQQQHGGYGPPAPFSYRQYSVWEQRHFDDSLLKCHSFCAFRDRQLAERLVTSRYVLVGGSAAGQQVRGAAADRFSGYRLVRSTRAGARGLLGETGVVDELSDSVYTADDVRHFAEKKQLAQQLDRVLQLAN